MSVTVERTRGARLGLEGEIRATDDRAGTGHRGDTGVDERDVDAASRPTAGPQIAGTGAGGDGGERAGRHGRRSVGRPAGSGVGRRRDDDPDGRDDRRDAGGDEGPADGAGQSHKERLLKHAMKYHDRPAGRRLGRVKVLTRCGGAPVVTSSRAPQNAGGGASCGGDGRYRRAVMPDRYRLTAYSHGAG